ncbi:tripartite motif-containing protein 45 isoform X2 [Takifugu rubripes]|uniref:tripartite motif-containing protein 45 isoform X2 n=1 Tax=Takifugu rubripes TaxID=31033 RepID=UPI001145D615|nr:tripartite motif-containing protein 45 isoform X2 [Takifugu rubripes]
MSQPDRIENEAELERNGPPANPRAVCNACKRLYRDPRILPCLHTFCSECIGQLEPFSMGGPPRGERPVVTVLCPTCDSEVDIPPSGPGALSTDHLALDEVFLETLVADGPLGCDLCGEGGAESRCEVCCVNLCGFCCQAHRRQKRTASHSVRCLKELKSAGRLSRPVLCSLHPGQELRLFCQPCDRPVCLECAATLHRDHHCSPTRDVVHRHGDRIRELVSGHLRPHLGHLKASLQKVEKSQDALQARVDATANEVRGFARGYASAVEAHCLSLLHRLEELHVQRRNQLHLQRAQLQQELVDVQGGVDFAERLLTCGSDAEILSAKAVTLKRLGSLAEGSRSGRPAAVAPDDGSGISFAASEPAGQVGGFPVVGAIVSKTVEVSKCTIEGEDLHTSREGERAHFLVVCRDSAGERMTRGGEHVMQGGVGGGGQRRRNLRRFVHAPGSGSVLGVGVRQSPARPGVSVGADCVQEVEAPQRNLSLLLLLLQRRVQRGPLRLPRNHARGLPRLRPRA